MFRRRYLPFLSLSLLFCLACNKTNDATITTAIQAKMFADPLLKSASIDISTKDGVVTLSGQVPSDAARAAARNIASQTRGVKQVIDSTSTVPPAPAAPATDASTQSLPPPPPAEPKPPREKRSSEKKTVVEPATPAAEPPAPVPAAPAVGSAQAAPPTPPAGPPAPVTPPPPQPPQPITVTIPESTIVTVRTIDAIDSSTSSTGQMFRGSLDAPIVVGDQVVVPKGLNVTLKLVNASSAGKFKGSSELTVSLESFTYQGKTYTLSTSDVQEKGASRGKRSAAVIGGGAALGALIGGLAGGGKGAAIGAGVGAGGGTAVQAMTKGQQVKIPSETRLDFTLHAPVAVTYVPHQKASRAAPASTDASQPANPSAPQ
jgi:outer membrane biosynthesis protein TonB